MKLTASQKKAVKILLDHPGITAREFAIFYLPADSPMHRKVSNQGNGSTRGKAAWLWAGSYLNKLKNKGIVISRIENTTRWYTYASKDKI